MHRFEPTDRARSRSPRRGGDSVTYPPGMGPSLDQAPAGLHFALAPAAAASSSTYGGWDEVLRREPRGSSPLQQQQAGGGGGGLGGDALYPPQHQQTFMGSGGASSSAMPARAGFGGGFGGGFGATGLHVPDPIMPLIAACRCVEDLCAVVKEHGLAFSALHDSTVCVNAGRMGAVKEVSKESRDLAVALFTERALCWLGRDSATYGRGARNAANVLHACAKLGLGEHDIAQLLAEEAARNAPMRNIKPQEASNCLWAMAKMGLRDMRLVEPMAICAVRLSSTQQFNSA
jgi:hypothetical protein